MPLASPRYDFQPPTIHGVPDDPGIYALYRGSELVCIGLALARGMSDTLRGCLQEHWDNKRPAGITHYHLGVDTDCLPAGTVIPKADPWIHFGDGKNVIEMSLPPGPHKLVLQSGDDMHRTIDGLCETINVTVVQ